MELSHERICTRDFMIIKGEGRGGEERRGGEGMEVNYAREKTRGLNIALDGVGLLTGERYYLRVE